MSLLGRMLGRTGADPRSQGIALYEQGRWAEALPLLRSVDTDRRRGDRPLHEFYLRQCLVLEGRRLLAAHDPDAASALFGEAAERWSTYPDLHFWHGIALALAARWEECLDAARAALRYNPDYVEARVLEAAALQEIADPEQVAASLNALLGSGTRVEHPLIRHLAENGPYTAEDLPADLLKLLHEAAADPGDADRVSEAVETCRSGNWDEGIVLMRELCDANPTYPDYRLRLSAALFQTGRNDEALTEIDSALRLNPRYRTAAHLKALILADQFRFRDAREVICFQGELTGPAIGHPGEALFCAYLAAVIALLTGRRGEVLDQLRPWRDLASSFPRAELLLAANDELEGREEEARARLEELCDKWSLDVEHHWFLGCHLAAARSWDRLEKIIRQWPRQEGEAPDRRREYLAALLRLSRGGTLTDADIPTERADEPAWRLLAIRSQAAGGDWPAALAGLRAIADAGELTEPVAGLLLRAYLALDDAGESDVPDAVSDDLLQDRLGLLHRRERTAQAMDLLRRRRELTPEDSRWTWLDPTFWLEPIRRWIG